MPKKRFSLASKLIARRWAQAGCSSSAADDLRKNGITPQQAALVWQGESIGYHYTQGTMTLEEALATIEGVEVGLGIRKV